MKIKQTTIRKIGKVDIFVLLLLLVLAVLTSYFLRFDKLLHVYFLDIGQGDAIFIQAPNGNQVLIDGGPDNTVIQRLGRVMPFYDRTIDMIVLTHPHADHVDGLIEVLKRYKVGMVAENFYSYRTAEYEEWNKAKLAAKVAEVHFSQTVDLGGGAVLETIYPFTNDGAANIKNPNNASVVLKLEYGRESVLLTGDIEAPVEQDILNKKENISADFLKVGHHGSKTSTTESFLRAVNPLIAFISVGAKNRYGHPHQIVLDRLEKLGVKYYRTDINRSSDLILDGKKYLIKNF